MVFLFDDLELDVSLFELRRRGVPVAVEPQVFSVLLYLISHRDRVVSKEELMDEVWGGRFVSETAVTSRIKQARRVVGDDGKSQRVIRTVHARGYRFIADTVEQDNRAAAPHPVSRPPAPVRYAISDGLHIAYQVTGHGDRDIVLVPGFLSHLDLDWEDPRHARFLDRLASFGRLIRFDKRGTGMSDRPDGLPDLETRMHDVLAVMDAAGSQRAVLFGYSEGGPMATLFAAAHPDRAEALVLYGAYAKRVWSEDYPWAQTREERTRYTEELVTRWDWESDMRWRCPSADADMCRWWAQRARAAATPSTVRRLMQMNDLVDVREALRAVRVPTLVLHRTGDQVSVLGNARYLAQHIADARLVELPGDDHFVSGDPDQILDPVESFLAEVRDPAPSAMALAALLILGGPDTGNAAGALAGGTARRASTRDGRPVLVFDGPATAIRAGVRYLAEHPDSRIGMGVHVAEIPRRTDRIDGHGVAAAVALAGLAPPAELWASATVRDLVAGSGLLLEPRGERIVAGLGSVPVFRAVGPDRAGIAFGPG
jgi:pimeloyl-ACP methyl ester carboxylesterase